MDVFDRLKIEIIKAAKEEQQRTQEELLPYFMEHMHTTSNLSSGSAKRLSKSTKKKPYKGKLRNAKNETNELYRMSRALMDALAPKGKGNISNTLPDGSFVHQIDLDVIPYARIHELGGEAGRKSKRVTIPARPYSAPAITDFMEKEMPKKAKRIVDAALKNI